MVALHEVSEAECARVAVPTFSAVIARSAGGAVLVFNLHRKVWELPGGWIDAGESPREAAMRELLEEAGCTGKNFRWLGLVEIFDRAPCFGGLFSCEVDHVPASVQNEEIGGIAYWRRDAAPHPLGTTDAALLDRFA
jgi:8-oxo-dGTP pyrophosphatase MutT (NUDIX family)